MAGGERPHRWCSAPCHARDRWRFKGRRQHQTDVRSQSPGVGSARAIGPLNADLPAYLDGHCDGQNGCRDCPGSPAQIAATIEEFIEAAHSFCLSGYPHARPREDCKRSLCRTFPGGLPRTFPPPERVLTNRGPLRYVWEFDVENLLGVCGPGTWTMPRSVMLLASGADEVTSRVIEHIEGRSVRRSATNLGTVELPQQTDIHQTGQARGFRAKNGPSSCKKDHSITSSARASSVAGISRPSALAVWRLITSSIFATCCTGRSLGLAPLRIWLAKCPSFACSAPFFNA